MRASLGMYGDDVGASIGKGCEIGISGCDHQMAVEDLGRSTANGLYDRRSKRDVGHEVPVHDVEVDPVGTGRIDIADLIAKL